MKIEMEMLEAWLQELTPFEKTLKAWYLKYGTLMPQEIFIQRHVELQSVCRKEENPFYRLDASCRDYEPAEMNKGRTSLNLSQVHWMNEKEHFFIQKHPNYFPEIPSEINMVSIVYMLQGYGELSLILEDRTENVCLKPGDLVFLAPGCKVMKKIAEDKAVLIAAGMSEQAFHKSLMESEGKGVLAGFLAGNICCRDNNSYLIFRTNGDAWVCQLFKRAMLEFAEGSMESYRIVALMMELIFAYVQKHYGREIILSVEGDSGISRIPAFLHYLQENYRDFSMEKMSKRFHFSTYYLSRMFRRYTGKSIQETLKEIRMTAAEALLYHTEYEVGEISELVGYRDVSFFIKTFRKEKGMTPLQYRKRNTR